MSSVFKTDAEMPSEPKVARPSNIMNPMNTSGQPVRVPMTNDELWADSKVQSFDYDAMDVHHVGRPRRGHGY